MRGANAGYWVEKIKANIDRDKARNVALTRQGWTVVRVWETDIRRDAEGQATRIAAILRNTQRPTKLNGWS
jgi:DNA mismatch endonuclease (patch repair protein)